MIDAAVINLLIYKRLDEFSSWVSLSGLLWLKLIFNRACKVEGHRFISIQYQVRNNNSVFFFFLFSANKQSCGASLYLNTK